MKRRRKPQAVKVQGTLTPNLNAEVRALKLKNATDIQPNVWIEKNTCHHCKRGDRYGMPLPFLLHYQNGGVLSVCFTCGKKAANETGLRLPATPLETEAREDAAAFTVNSYSESKKNGGIKNGDL